jgi:hypothetical protein
MIQSLGATLIEKIDEAASVTHVICSDGKTSIRRTPKLMIALCRTANVVNLDWLVKSAQQRKALPSDDFLILGDKQAEKQYAFSMRHTLNTVTSRLRTNELLLESWSVYICTGVADNKAPPAKELKLMVEAAGGTYLSSPTCRGTDYDKLLIITSDPETKRQVTKGVVNAVAMGATKQTTSWLFTAMMTQEINL